MTKNFQYQGKTYDYFFTMDNEESVEKYDNARIEYDKQVKTISANEATLIERNRQVMQAMTVFIDSVLGDGTCNETFGEQAKPTEIMKMTNTLLIYVQTRTNEENNAVEVIPQSKRKNG